MGDNSSPLPVGLRRSPRQPAVRLHASTSPSQRRPRQHAVSKAAATPRQTKRARSSLSDSILVRDVEVGPMTPPTTGGRRSIRKAIPTTNKRRKYSKPYGLTTPDSKIRSHDYDGSHVTTPGCNEVRIFPLRAILDDRVQRRIRRNGLSEEMNTIYGERRQRAKNNVEEMQRLRIQLAAKEAENDLLREQSSLLQDTSRIMELEKEMSGLRQGLRNDNFSNIVDVDWDMAAGDGFTDDDSFSDMDSRFRDDTTLEVESADSVSHGDGKPYIDTLKAFTPPRTSPTKSASSDTLRYACPAASCDVGVQAAFGDAGQSSLEIELVQLRHELADLQKALQTKEQLGSPPRANVTAMQDCHPNDDVDPDLQLQTDIMLQTLAEKTAALTNLNSLISTLGSPSSDASEIVSTLREAFESARQELEQIFPDEKPIDMSLECKVTLDTLLQRLRDSASQAKKYEALLGDSCIREQHLQDRLDDCASAMDAMSSRLREKDDRIFRLEADMERSEAIVDDIRKTLAEERLTVEQQNSELIEMRANLRSMVSMATDLQAQLAQVQVEREIEMNARESAYKDEIQKREAKLLELHEEITSLKEALTLAHKSTSRLQEENERLKGISDRDKKAARDTVAALRTQLLQSLETSEAFLA
ncbi:hypothetical protein N0V93_005147 [Gnomoniopsis smithogilvyi]|uniref:Uncharacterized protein n=1 Tax=Gnomoniopsis smithogilvyi TaxID=1191159 RepID=A0A9W8YW52_9PEZI|nr:hypothetical protein N0V93_005147 [Gnomoniopsis smithogilvyi]